MTSKKILTAVFITLTYVGVAMVACGITGKVVFSV